MSRESAARWGVPEAVQIAIIHQESRFVAGARPPRKRFLWIFPGARPSSAYGYGQIPGWNLGRLPAERGPARGPLGTILATWSTSSAGTATAPTGARAIAKDDAGSLYLAYHEGIGGFTRGTHTGKAWLLAVARKVSRRSALYQKQYDACRESLSRKRFLGIF